MKVSILILLDGAAEGDRKHLRFCLRECFNPYSAGWCGGRLQQAIQTVEAIRVSILILLDGAAEVMQAI